MKVQAQETLATLFMRLYQERYTGSVVLHFGQGVPSEADIPAPSTRIRLTKSENSATLARNT